MHWDLTFQVISSAFHHWSKFFRAEVLFLPSSHCVSTEQMLSKSLPLWNDQGLFSKGTTSKRGQNHKFKGQTGTITFKGERCGVGRQNCDSAACTWEGIWSGAEYRGPRGGGTGVLLDHRGRNWGGWGHSHLTGMFQLKCYPNMHGFLTSFLFKPWNSFSQEKIP